MKRRSFLAATGTLGAVGLAGCTGGDGGGPAGGGPTDETTDDTTATPTTAPKTGRPTTTDGGGSGWRFDPASDEPHASVTVGDRENVLFPDDNRPHGVSVWNDSDDARDVRVVATADCETRLDETWTVPTRAVVAVTLAGPAEYEVTVHVAGEEAGVVPVGSGHFDCNDSGTRVQVTPDGDLRFHTITTLVACTDPQVATSAVTSEEGACGSRDDASVSVDGTTVTVSGNLGAPTPCHVAELGGAWDDDHETLTLTVAPVDDGSEGCVECVGEVPYEATVMFERSLPARVVVEHDNWGEASEVAAADLL